ncbi:hypothetical protein [Ferrovibrio sp.]|uniref:hypothetical protein n=1 Tax=Ferrovibrio sp. TaxID=1917215 RepID=UPI000CC72783|nr:hypothetical protein [Ferrovibrio sp.]PJI42389.1 MAG: hypothetical protein CTR53_08215 [Ferrovibrio sp.]
MAAPHRLAFGFIAAVLLLWAGLFGWTLQRAALPPEASGRVIAVYPFGWNETTVTAAAMRTEARLVRQTWLTNAVELASDDAGFADRLRDSGAIAVYRAQPFNLFTLAGCTGLPPLLPSLRRFG